MKTKKYLAKPNVLEIKGKTYKWKPLKIKDKKYRLTEWQTLA